MLMQRLYDRGHRHISFLGVPHSDVTTGQRRHQAYLDFCKKTPHPPPRCRVWA
jgi:LacI family trehalose operon transcriptional repressor